MTRGWITAILFFWLCTVVHTLQYARMVGWHRALLLWVAVLLYYGMLPYLGRRVASWVLCHAGEISDTRLRTSVKGLLVLLILLFLLGPFLAGLVEYGLIGQLR